MTPAGLSAPASVVVVDDTPANVTLLERVLAAMPSLRVHGFTDPREALAHCAGCLPDLVLLDLHMPGLDGFEVMDALRALVPEPGFLPVLVLTADATTTVKERALAAGAKDFLVKPFDRTEVLLRVGNLLETKALHRRLEEHNADLRSSLEVHEAAQRAAAAEVDRRRRRVAAALEPGAFGMVFQPVADLASGKVVGVEALARFAREPRRPPDEWFAEASQVGREVELEVAAVVSALGQLHLLPDETYMAVNVGPTTAVSEALADVLSHHPGERVVLELTEHVQVDDYEVLLSALARLRGRGVRVAVDDTGAGYAGLQRLLRVRPDVVKLDTALTRSIDTDPVRRSLASAITTFGGEIGAAVIAEGVETAAELAALRHTGITLGQGYLLARPAHLPLRALRLDLPG